MLLCRSLVTPASGDPGFGACIGRLTYGGEVTATMVGYLGCCDCDKLEP